MDASRTRPRLPRRTRSALVATMAVALLVTSALVVGSPVPASADTVNSTVQVSCTTPFGAQNSTLGVVATDTPDPAAGGEPMVIAYTVGSVSSYPVDLLTSTWQMPPQVSAYDVTYANLGTLVEVAGTPLYGSNGSSVTVALTGGSPGGPVPTIEIHVMVKPAAAGQTIDWPVFDSVRTVTSGVPIFGTVDSTCTPRGSSIGQTLNSTTVTPPEVCTQVSTDDGWTKTLWGIGPGGINQSNGTANTMYTTDDGTNRFASSLKFPVVGGACDQGGTLPAGATVIDASVRLTKVKNCVCIGPVQRLHRITQSWSEANLLPNTGPTIDGTASAQFATPTTFADVTSAQLTADVQAFVDTPAINEGWSLRQRYNGSGDTGNPADPAGFATREHATAGSRPALTITYLP